MLAVMINRMESRCTVFALGCGIETNLSFIFNPG
jgi:hypothetical protein